MSFQITKDFHTDEFTWSNAAEKHASLNDHNSFLLRSLCEDILQPMRDHFGRITITSGIRDKRIIKALKAAGYPVSSTTDHSYGDVEVYRFGVGAADIVPKEAKGEDGTDALWNVYEWCVEQYNRGKLPFGQCIIYPDPDDNPLTHDGFIHISNKKTLVYSDEYVVESALTGKNEPPNNLLVYRSSWEDGQNQYKYRAYRGERI